MKAFNLFEKLGFSSESVEFTQIGWLDLSHLSESKLSNDKTAKCVVSKKIASFVSKSISLLESKPPLTPS